MPIEAKSNWYGVYTVKYHTDQAALNNTVRSKKNYIYSALLNTPQLMSIG